MTAREHLRWASERLTAKEGARLLAAASGLTVESLWRQLPEEVATNAARRFRRMVRAVAEGFPEAYVRGRAFFWNLDLAVGPGVLCPRPETEHLVETVLELGGPPGTLVADVGTGSGAVGLALKRERPDWRVVATEISPAARRIALSNVRRLGLEMEIFPGNLLTPLATRGIRPDILVMNPPYVAAGDRLGRELRAEPPRALWGGRDGLSFYRRLADGACALLRPAGHMAVEIGAGRERDVTEVVERRGTLRCIRSVPDLAGIPRVLLFEKEAR